MRIKANHFAVILTIILMVFSFHVTLIHAQPQPPNVPGEQPIIINPGPLPMKTLLASEPLRLQLTGPFDLAYNVTVAQTISVYVRSLPDNPAPLDTTLEIDDPQGDQVAFNDDLKADSRDAGVENISLDAPGTYIIHLNTFDLLQGGGVEVELVTSAPPDAGNGNGGTTSILDEQVTLDGNGPAQFTFQGREGQVVTITAQALNPTSPDLDLNMALFGPDGDQIASDDDSGANEGLGERDPALVHFSLPQSGEYRLEISSWFDTPGDIAVKDRARVKTKF